MTSIKAMHLHIYIYIHLYEGIYISICVYKSTLGTHCCRTFSLFHTPQRHSYNYECLINRRLLLCHIEVSKCRMTMKIRYLPHISARYVHCFALFSVLSNQRRTHFPWLGRLGVADQWQATVSPLCLQLPQVASKQRSAECRRLLAAPSRHIFNSSYMCVRVHVCVCVCVCDVYVIWIRCFNAF